MRFALLAACFLLLGAQARADEVLDSDTAIRIARASPAASPHVGEANAKSQEPYYAELKDGTWTVGGTAHVQPGTNMATYRVDISEKTGKVIGIGVEP
jgi:hypothetical protein